MLNITESKLSPFYITEFRQALRTDAKTKGKKPQCQKPTSYNCGQACINISKSCKNSPDDAIAKGRLNKLRDLALRFVEIKDNSRLAGVDKQITEIEKLRGEKAKRLSEERAEKRGQVPVKVLTDKISKLADDWDNMPERYRSKLLTDSKVRIKVLDRKKYREGSFDDVVALIKDTKEKEQFINELKKGTYRGLSDEGILKTPQKSSLDILKERYKDIDDEEIKKNIESLRKRAAKLSEQGRDQMSGGKRSTQKAVAGHGGWMLYNQANDLEELLEERAAGRSQVPVKVTVEDVTPKQVVATSMKPKVGTKEYDEWLENEANNLTGEKATFTIKTKKGDETVEGLVVKGLGVHEAKGSLFGLYGVTHIKTGRSLGEFENEKLAKKVAIELQKSGVDWEAEDIRKIPGINKKMENIQKSIEQVQASDLRTKREKRNKIRKENLKQQKIQKTKDVSISKPAEQAHVSVPFSNKPDREKTPDGYLLPIEGESVFTHTAGMMGASKWNAKVVKVNSDGKTMVIEKGWEQTKTGKPSKMTVSRKEWKVEDDPQIKINNEKLLKERKQEEDEAERKAKQSIESVNTAVKSAVDSRLEKLVTKDDLKKGDVFNAYFNSKYSGDYIKQTFEYTKNGFAKEILPNGKKGSEMFIVTGQELITVPVTQVKGQTPVKLAPEDLPKMAGQTPVSEAIETKKGVTTQKVGKQTKVSVPVETGGKVAVKAKTPKQKAGAKYLEDPSTNQWMKNHEGLKAIAKAIDENDGVIDTGTRSGFGGEYLSDTAPQDATKVGVVKVHKLNKPSKAHPYGSATVTIKIYEEDGKQNIDLPGLADGVKHELKKKQTQQTPVKLPDDNSESVTKTTEIKEKTKWTNDNFSADKYVQQKNDLVDKWMSGDPEAKKQLDNWVAEAKRKKVILTIPGDVAATPNFENMVRFGAISKNEIEQKTRSGSELELLRTSFTFPISLADALQLYESQKKGIQKKIKFKFDNTLPDVPSTHQTPVKLPDDFPPAPSPSSRKYS